MKGPRGRGWRLFGPMGSALPPTPAPGLSRRSAASLGAPSLRARREPPGRSPLRRGGLRGLKGLERRPVQSGPRARMGRMLAASQACCAPVPRRTRVGLLAVPASPGSPARPPPAAPPHGLYGGWGGACPNDQPWVLGPRRRRAPLGRVRAGRCPVWGSQIWATTGTARGGGGRSPGWGLSGSTCDWAGTGVGQGAPPPAPPTLPAGAAAARGRRAGLPRPGPPLPAPLLLLAVLPAAQERGAPGRRLLLHRLVRGHRHAGVQVSGRGGAGEGRGRGR